MFIQISDTEEKTDTNTELEETTEEEEELHVSAEERTETEGEQIMYFLMCATRDMAKLFFQRH